ncbi:biotin transporter BioY [Caldalkalibacillus salinus]|uniref:biotin transporter BioY n=1 Tax=Caldalkalibacillus salinus TaxID=2803787 RepID=UPI001920F69F|nr:biotin transporter BioY [Caldalkalibacillus salinus]
MKQNESRTRLKYMMYVSLMAALVAVMGFVPPIPVPWFPAPIILQTLGVMLAGVLLGARLGALSIIVFLTLVAIGAVPLSGGNTGISVFAGHTGGYLLSWPLAAFIIGYIVERNWQSINAWKVALANVLGGMLLMYLMGSLFLNVVYQMPFLEMLIGNAIFIPGDTVKVIVATSVAMRMYKVKPLIQTPRPRHQQEDNIKWDEPA